MLGGAGVLGVWRRDFRPLEITTVFDLRESGCVVGGLTSQASVEWEQPQRLPQMSAAGFITLVGNTGQSPWW